jgi:hypothetical protein
MTDTTDTPPFDAAAEAAALKAHTQAIRKKRYYPSQLDRYRGELLQLHQAGVTTAELQRWLRAKKVKVVWSTVSRWLHKLESRRD